MLSKSRRMYRRKAKKTLTKRRRPFRRVRDVADIASCSVKRTIVPDAGGNFLTNVMYNMRDTVLATYLRAVQVSRAYQHYRIKKIALTLKPTYDTYQIGAGNPSRPQIYYIIDKSGSIPAGINLEALKQMGAKAHRFDEKPFTISWRPSVLTADQTNVGTLPAQYKISPFLSTDQDQVDHLGVFWFVEQLFGGGVQYNAEVEVQFEFKKPKWTTLVVGSEGNGVKPALEDNSADGIVGGPDSNNQPLAT